MTPDSKRSSVPELVKVGVYCLRGNGHWACYDEEDAMACGTKGPDVFIAVDAEDYDMYPEWLQRVIDFEGDRAEHSPSAERTEIERLSLALTRAMDRGNAYEAELQIIDECGDALIEDGYGYIVDAVREALTGSAPVPEAPTPLGEYAELEGTLADGLEEESP